MDSSIELQKLQLELTVKNLALSAVCAELNSTQRDMALTNFRFTVEKIIERFRPLQGADTAIPVFAGLCAQVEEEMQEHGPLMSEDG